MTFYINHLYANDEIRRNEDARKPTLTFWFVISENIE